ncbi:MAG TPA: hypothetical protein VFH90_11130 [Candidatus Limnocylindria bacterium]|nr:hypothetical protein [Candidatus Limnocylindria bacterium]
MRMAKLITGAGLLVVASVIGGTLIGGVLAAPGGASSNDAVTDAHGGPWLGGANGEYCDEYLDTLASELGVERDSFLPASKAAAIAAIEAAVEGNDLDEDRADQLIERIEAVEEADCGFIGALGKSFMRGFGLGFGHGFVSADLLEAAASALGMGSAELLSQMADDNGLEEIAAAQGVDYERVKAAITDALQEDLDAAVAEGLDQERADEIVLRVQTWLDEGGEPSFGRFFDRPGRGEESNGEI